ncbi:urocanate hydratase [Anaeramoeba flamelloides]|uniref:urocanate hydratase n=1 Tax=Anaeramoeba flamelloides TaxID=1746091 RepID=A0ABQ8XRD3_9EUKA|nr:urocanate hydratase [Anaeramoeba flamelloides]
MTEEKLVFGLQVDPLPKPQTERDSTVPHAPKRQVVLTQEEKKLALTNALRFFPKSVHNDLIEEFLFEFNTYGHIYMYRFRPQYKMCAKPIKTIPAKSRIAAAIMLMIMNNLDPEVAQFPHELITYGGNGSVFSNWAQYQLTMEYLSTMSDEQTLVMCSGTPMGLFPSHSFSPRVVITNGMMIPLFSTSEMYQKLYAMGNTIYGQMTAGSYCYIGPMGIVHGTTLTIMNAGRKYLKTNDMSGRIFVTAGLGGMSGAQGKAAVIAGATTIIAEVSKEALEKRYRQGWIQEKSEDIDEIITIIKDINIQKKKGTKLPGRSIGFYGNVVDLWERLAKESEEAGETLVELGSDQTSLHNPFNGGYYPVDVTFEESNEMMTQDPEKFKKLVHESLKRQVNAINKLSELGMHFFDYGNAFLLQSSKAGADIMNEKQTGFKYPSYVEDIMGPMIFDYGFGPFRWVCTSCDPNDLKITDEIASEICLKLSKEAPKETKQQYLDNYKWIVAAEENKLVVGSQARILYSDEIGRSMIALAFNEAVKSGRLSAPVLISRDHHDVSGTDSPFRETSSIKDGSMYCADMSVQNVIGDGFRGGHLVAVHNGGGVGWGYVMNGGFQIILDGSEEVEKRINSMLFWDVNNGVNRRAWSGSKGAQFTIKRAMERNNNLKVTLRNDLKEMKPAITNDDTFNHNENDFIFGWTYQSLNIDYQNLDRLSNLRINYHTATEEE